MKLLGVMLIFLIPLFSSGQVFKGTYLIGAICSDGILIGTDSRLSLYHPDAVDADGVVDNSKVLAYADTFQKIYTLRNVAIATVGIQSLNGKFFNYYIDRMNEKFTNPFDIGTAFNFIDSFFYYQYPELMPAVNSLLVVLAGYKDGVPYLCSISNGAKKAYSSHGMIDTDTLSGFPKLYSNKKTCAQMAQSIFSMINTISKKNGFYNTIGGPPMILQVKSDNTFKWLRNRPKKPPIKEVAEVYRLFNQGKLKMIFTSPKAKQEFADEAKKIK